MALASNALGLLDDDQFNGTEHQPLSSFENPFAINPIWGQPTELSLESLTSDIFSTATKQAAAAATAGASTAANTATFATDQTIGNYIANTSPTGGGGRHFLAGSTVTVNLSGLAIAGELLYARTALAAWSRVANISFVETTGSAQITLSDDANATTYDAYTSTSYASSTLLSSASIHISQKWYNDNGGALGTTGVLNSYGYQTYVHELGHALGLGHSGPYNGSATYGVDNIFTNDSWQYSIMSYFDQTQYGAASRAFVTSAQVADIYGIQLLYGAPTGQTNNKFGYGATAGAEFDLAQSNSFTIYSSTGTADLDASQFGGAQTVNFNAGTFSSIKGLTNNIGLALNTTLTRYEGGSGNDTIILDGANIDRVINGGGGTDTVYVTYNFGSGYSIGTGSTSTNLVMAGTAGRDTLQNIEFVHFADGATVSTASLMTAAVASYHVNDLSYSGSVVPAYASNAYIDGLNYIASFNDLIAAFGANEQAGSNHFLQYGIKEGRVETFDGIDYVASYADLIGAFGSGSSIKAIEDAGADHFINFGNREGRSTTFNGLDYIASYSDLIKAFGANGDAGAFHDIKYGYREGRTVSFDGLSYIAQYTDLMHAFSTNEQAGAAHFINYGSKEGRTTSFDSAGYIAAHADLVGKYATTDQFLTAYINTYNSTGHLLT